MLFHLIRAEGCIVCQLRLVPAKADGIQELLAGLGIAPVLVQQTALRHEGAGLSSRELIQQPLAPCTAREM